MNPSKSTRNNNVKSNLALSQRIWITKFLKY
jgi:hypothetical protein